MPFCPSATSTLKTPNSDISPGTADYWRREFYSLGDCWQSVVLGGPPHLSPVFVPHQLFPSIGHLFQILILLQSLLLLPICFLSEILIFMSEFTSGVVVHIKLVILDSFLNVASLQHIWSIFCVSGPGPGVQILACKCFFSSRSNALSLPLFPGGLLLVPLLQTCPPVLLLTCFSSPREWATLEGIALSSWHLCILVLRLPGWFYLMRNQWGLLGEHLVSLYK